MMATAKTINIISNISYRFNHFTNVGNMVQLITSAYALGSLNNLGFVHKNYPKYGQYQQAHD